MNLHEYLSSPGAMTVAQLREAIGGDLTDAQIRQWQHGYSGRKPGPTNCMAIERVTKGKVTVEELDPKNKWVRVKDKSWPHPGGKPLIDYSARAPSLTQPA